LSRHVSGLSGGGGAERNRRRVDGSSTDFDSTWGIIDWRRRPWWTTYSATAKELKNIFFKLLWRRQWHSRTVEAHRTVIK